VTKQLPAERAKRLAMPYDEFKLRVRDAVLAFPDVGAAQSQLGFAQAGATESRAPLLPQINGFTESGKRSVGKDSYLGTAAYTRDGTNLGVSVRQVLFDFGAALFGFQSGKAKELAAQELLNSKRSEQALKTVASVIDLERARAQMNLATDNVSSRLAIVKLVRERFEVGGGSKPDIIRAEARYAEALATVTNAQNRLKAAEAAYREAFAANPIGIIRGPNFEVPVEKLDATAEQLAGTYPGLQQLAKLRDSAGAEAKSAFAKTLPSVNLAYDNIMNGVSAPLAPSRTVNLLLQFKYNFYTGGAETARKDQADFKAKQAEQEFQSGLRQYERVLTQNQEDVRNSDALLAARKVAATSAISSMRAVREQFAFNKGTLLDLLTVQEGLFNAGRDLVDAEADRQISRYRYLHLTSGLDRLFDLSEATYDVRSEARSEVRSEARGEVRK
jgi:adhesin transport system outer membrane protein